VVAALKLKQAGVKSIGIVDCDQHYGDGTVNLLKRHSLREVQHYTFGGDNVTASTAARWLQKLPSTLEKFKDCQVLLYQAGADPYINDPLGGVLTKDQLRQRDQIVFEYFHALKIPVAWNLAGGYTNPFSEVLEIHTNTVIECLKAMNGGAE
jgi:acetoin utilization deacetylase AcuC-like enzyme